MNDLPRTTYSYSSNFDHLSFVARPAAFRHSEGRSLLDLAVFIPNSELVYRNGHSNVKLNIAVFDSNYNRVYDSRASLNTSSKDPNGGMVDLKSVPLPADRYVVSLEAINNDTDKVGIYQLPVTVRDYTGSNLVISDLVPAVGITKEHGRFYKETAGLNVVPNPAPVLDKNKPLFLYFEVYNLTLDENGRSHYEVRYVINRKKKKVLGLFGSGETQEISQITTKEADSRTVYEFLGLDVSALKEGQVTIKVEIADLLSNSRSQSELSAVLR